MLVGHILSFKSLLPLIILTFLSFNLEASVQNKQIWQQQPLGSARLTYLWWKVYDSSFYCQQTDNLQSLLARTGQDSSDVINEINKLVAHCGQIALKIHYLRDIDKDDLIKETKKQWQHLGIKHSDLARWLKTLGTIWPNLKKGDELIFSVHSGSKTSQTFFYNEKSIGQINSDDFAFAFLAIWLSHATSEPELRQKLLGLD